MFSCNPILVGERFCSGECSLTKKELREKWVGDILHEPHGEIHGGLFSMKQMGLISCNHGLAGARFSSKECSPTRTELQENGWVTFFISIVKKIGVGIEFHNSVLLGERLSFGECSPNEIVEKRMGDIFHGQYREIQG